MSHQIKNVIDTLFLELDKYRIFSLCIPRHLLIRYPPYYCNAEVIQPNPEFPVVGSLIFIDKAGKGNYERGQGPLQTISSMLCFIEAFQYFF